MSKKILIIDDDKDFVNSLKQILETEGYEVKEAFSAKEGIQKLSDTLPDLIILDVMMESETAGFHLAYQLKSVSPSSVHKKIPILMLTAIGEIQKIYFDKKTDGDFLPVEAFLEKPVKPELLLSTVQHLLK